MTIEQIALVAALVVGAVMIAYLIITEVDRIFIVIPTILLMGISPAILFGYLHVKKCEKHNAVPVGFSCVKKDAVVE